MSKNVKYDASKITERLRDHSLYIAFAPADKPKIALAVIVENAGFGAAAAAPIARMAIDYYLTGKRPDEPPPKPKAKDAAPAEVTQAPKPGSAEVTQAPKPASAGVTPASKPASAEVTPVPKSGSAGVTPAPKPAPAAPATTTLPGRAN